MAKIVGKAFPVAGVNKFQIKGRPNKADAEFFKKVAFFAFIVGRGILMKNGRVKNGAGQPFKNIVGLVIARSCFIKKAFFRKARRTDRIHRNMHHLKEYDPANELSDDMYALR